MNDKMIENIKNYEDKFITIENFVEVVRQMPGFYIGAIGNPGFMNMIREIFQNSIDELMKADSPCTEVIVSYDENTNTVIVEDNGRGIPHDSIIRIFDTEHTGTNYKKEPGEYSSGRHGVGSKVTKALSSLFIVKSFILGKGREVQFNEGFAWDKGEIEIENPDKYQGTIILFQPTKMMGEITVKCEDVLALIRAISVLTKIGSVLHFNGIKLDGTEVHEKIVNEDGILTDLILKTTNPIIKPIVYFEDTGICKAEIAFTYDSDDLKDADITNFSNFCPMKDGGTHVTGFMDGLTLYFSRYMNKFYLANNKKLKVVNNDIKTGLKAIVNVSHLNPIFGGQAKDSLTNEDMYTFVKNLTYKSLEKWSKENANDLQKICKYFKDVAEIRVKSETEKVKIGKLYNSSVLTGLPKKYKKPNGSKGDKLELIIVEGDSAAGAALDGRDNVRQGIFPIRGKIPNALTAKKQDFLNNEEIKGLITLIGGGYGKSFDINKVEWDKIIIMTDADPDGYHIRTLLAKFFALYMPALIISGKLYGSVPPLYGLKKGKDKMEYFTNELDYAKYVQKHFSKNNVIQDVHGKTLTDMEILNILYNNSNYVKDIDVIYHRYAINPYLLECILSNYDYIDNFEQLKSTIESDPRFRFLKVDKTNNTINIKGLLDSQYQTIILNKQFKQEIYPLLKYIKCKNIFYILNGTMCSLYTVMTHFKKSSPSNITRYKGLGEMNSNQLKESALAPSANRQLLRYNIKDLAKEMEQLRYLESNKKVLIAGKF